MVFAALSAALMVHPATTRDYQVGGNAHLQPFTTTSVSFNQIVTVTNTATSTLPTGYSQGFIGTVTAASGGLTVGKLNTYLSTTSGGPTTNWGSQGGIQTYCCPGQVNCPPPPPGAVCIPLQSWGYTSTGGFSVGSSSTTISVGEQILFLASESSYSGQCQFGGGGSDATCG